MKSFLRTFLIAGVPFGIAMGFVIGLDRGWSGIIYWGIVEGSVFGFVMATIAWFQENRMIESPPVLTDETLIREERASYQSDNRRIFGRLYLTNKRLLFEGLHNKKAFEVSIPIHSIVRSEVAKVMGILPNGLRIRTRHEEVEIFLTDNARLLAEDIVGLREDYLSEPRTEPTGLFS